jgi:hypothetical protein
MFTSPRGIPPKHHLDQSPRGRTRSRDDRRRGAIAAHALMPGMPWAVAVALGAIVSQTRWRRRQSCRVFPCRVASCSSRR